MSFRVGFYKFSKKRNSTIRPPAESGEVYLNCDALYPTGVLSPRIVVETDENPTAWNYAYINQFNRYYFVTEWTADNGFWVASLRVDPLASYKEEIGASDLYVLRASNEQDGDVREDMYPLLTNPSRQVHTAASPWSENWSSGRFIVGVVGPAGNGVTYYVFSWANFHYFVNELMDNIDWMNIDTSELSSELTKALVNPIQYIVSCKWVPREPVTGSTVTEIAMGFWKISASAQMLTTVSRSFNVDFELSKHPQAASRGSFMNSAPYSELALEFPPFGRVELNSSMFADVDSVRCVVDIDYISGWGTLQIYESNTTGAGSMCNTRLEAMLGVNVPIAQIQSDVRGAVNALGGSIGDLAGGLSPSSIIGALGGVASAITAMDFPTVTCVGSSSGSTSILSQPPKIKQVFWWLPEDDKAHRGRPLLKNRTPAALRGYILAADGDISAPATAEELAEIKGFIESGFFYE